MDATLSDSQVQALIEAVRDRYGVDIEELSPLGGEYDVHFRALVAGHGPQFLRLTPEPIDAAGVAWQNAVLLQIERRPLSVSAPKLLRQLDGAVDSSVRLDDRDFLLRMTTWVSGSPVSDLGAIDRGFRLQLGGLAAEAIDCLSPLNETAGEHDHHWMVERSGTSLRATINAATDPHRRALLDTALAWFDGVAPHLSELPRSVTHQDLHDFNVMAERDEEGRTRITGVVDFNDAAYTIRVAELAIAAAYSALRQEDGFGAFCDVVEGYLAKAALTDLELRVLYPLAVSRLSVNASTWTQRSTGSNADYAEARMAATWPALEQLLSVDPEEAAARFLQLRDGAGNQG
jgi:Ser/Thr protein kinase RdoA (MazF antagonist)